MSFTLRQAAQRIGKLVSIDRAIHLEPSDQVQFEGAKTIGKFALSRGSVLVLLERGSVLVLLEVAEIRTSYSVFQEGFVIPAGRVLTPDSLIGWVALSDLCDITEVPSC